MLAPRSSEVRERSSACDDAQANHAVLEELPLGKAHLMTFQLTPIGPLNPLRQLLAPAVPHQLKKLALGRTASGLSVSSLKRGPVKRRPPIQIKPQERRGRCLFLSKMKP
jgi:hypothetical protein